MHQRTSFLTRRTFLRLGGGVPLLFGLKPEAALSQTAAGPTSDVFWETGVPDSPFNQTGFPNNHAGVDGLLLKMGIGGLKFYRSSKPGPLSGPLGLIGPEDVVLIKVNAQWKHRGATNSDVVRGLIQKILDHPDVFSGEIVIIENGQGKGSLNCDTISWNAYPDRSVRANAENPAHSFLYLVNGIFHDPRVSAYELDAVRGRFIGRDDHHTDGYRRWGTVSYPCFTTEGGFRVELKDGLWDGTRHRTGLKLINVPVLKHHDEGGSEITASLKHMYGVLSMDDGYSASRHYAGLGTTCGHMMADIRAPVLNILDAVWVSHRSLKGTPASTTHRANQLMAGQDPVALDYMAAKHILYPIDRNPRHHPDFAGIKKWLTEARDTINASGGLSRFKEGIYTGFVTYDEQQIRINPIGPLTPSLNRTARRRPTPSKGKK